MISTYTYAEPHAINAFVYCPRRWYYQSVLKLHLPNDALEIGTYDHDHYWQQTVKRREVYLVSSTLKMKGKCDYLIEEDGIQIPLEIKKGHCTGDNPYENDVMQLIGYILLLEEHFSIKYAYGYVIYMGSRKRYRVNVTDALRAKLRWYVMTLRMYTNQHKLPPRQKQQNKCDRCSLLLYCWI